MFIYRSNSMEALVDALADVVTRPVAAGSPTAGLLLPETIVVQSRGMQRWLSVQLAQRLGAWAHCEYPFPRSFIEGVFGAVLDEDELAVAAFRRERLTWAIARELRQAAMGSPAASEAPAEGWGAVGRYLARDEDGSRRLALARRVASVFDQYAVYRPEMVLGWQQPSVARASDDDWQALLWRRLVTGAGPVHFAGRAAAFFAAWGRNESPPPRLPARVTIVGIPTLPPLYLRILAALSERVEIHLFLLSPCREYWADARPKARSARPPSDPESTAERGPPLLLHLGRTAREFQDVLESNVSASHERELYREPTGQHLLGWLQADMLHFRGPGVCPPSPARRLRPDDRSLRVHSCHGPLRQLEVLHDELRDAFERDTDLRPEEVLVMAPDIEAFSPLIDAVFGARIGDREAIPYRVADRSVRTSSPYLEAFFGLLELAASRMKASRLLDVLGRPPIFARLGITRQQLDDAGDWVEQVGIRWGIDAAQRALEGQPPTELNSWRFGLRRMLLGYAMPTSRKGPYRGHLPFDDIEGDRAIAVGCLVDYCEGLFDTCNGLRAPRTVQKWCQALRGLARESLSDEGSWAWEAQLLSETLSALEGEVEAEDFDEQLGLSAMVEALELRFADQRSTHAFLSGGVTFCAMLPMRSIPFKVVAVLGMNDGAFPRIERSPSFDIIARERRLGDRSLRDEDCHLFLEALLSARQQFIVTYTGQSLQDNAPLPPAVVVSELLEAIAATFADEAANQGVAEQLVVVHPLHAFSPEYFSVGEASQLFSYAASAARGARALSKAEREAPPPFSLGLLPSEPSPAQLALGELEQLVCEPQRWWLEGQLGVRVDVELASWQDREPLTIDGLDSYLLRCELLERVEQGQDEQLALDAYRASGRLPWGSAGRLAFEEHWGQASALVRELRARAPGEPGPVRHLGQVVAGRRIVGSVERLYPGAHVLLTPRRLGAKTRLRGWCRHLLLAASDDESLPRETWLIGRGAASSPVQVERLLPLDRGRALEELGVLVELVEWARRCPLRFFPEAATSYLGELSKGQGEPGARDKAARAARRTFLGSGGHRGYSESEDPRVALCFGDTDPLLADAPAEAASDRGPDFPTLAARILAPLLAHHEELEPCAS